MPRYATQVVAAVATQISSPKSLLDYLPFFCRLFSRRSSFLDIFSSFSKVRFIKKADESASAAAGVDTEETAVEHAARLHSPLMSRQYMDLVILDSFSSKSSIGWASVEPPPPRRQLGYSVSGSRVILPKKPRVRESGGDAAKKILNLLFKTH